MDQKQTLKVLLVDDDRDDSLLFSRLLCRLHDYPIEFTWTSDYDNARELIESRDYHIHFLDYRLGSRSGLELMENTLLKCPGKSFVMVSGVGNEHLAAESIRLGALDYISKADLSADELSRCISHCVRAAEDRTRTVERVEMDGLTGVYRREVFEEAAERRMKVDAGAEAAWTLLFVDIDHFKQINDDFGHQHGDEVLRKVADAIRSCLRERDIVCRYGGEEFCVLTAGGDKQAAAAIGERIRETVQKQAGVTVSIGVAREAGPEARLKSLVGHADAMMYQAKQNGRNRVEIENG